jgi:KipI family sensor histidine kinase inhibitor
MNRTYPRLLPSGDSALVIEFGDHIDAELNRRVLALDALLASEKIPAIRETVPTYRSLLVHYDPLVTGFSELGAKLMGLAKREGLPTRKGRRWRVPVVYGGEYGIDLEAVAERHGMTPEEVIRRHSAGDYRVYMLGFLPGYTYLGGLDPKLATPRRQDPRLETPSGTVAIGGVQTGIQCITAPSGWNLLGRTPVRTYHPHRDPIFLIEPGDHVRFFQVPAREWEVLDRAAEAGEPIAEIVEMVDP